MSPLETFLMKAEDSPVISLVVISRGAWPEFLWPSVVETTLTGERGDCHRKSFPSSVTPAFWLRPQATPTTRESEGVGRTRGRVTPPPHM
jgi:hypothetical protein